MPLNLRYKKKIKNSEFFVFCVFLLETTFVFMAWGTKGALERAMGR